MRLTTIFHFLNFKQSFSRGIIDNNRDVKRNSWFLNLITKVDFVSIEVANKNLLMIKNLAIKLENIKWSKETIIETIKTFSFEKKIDFKDVAKLIRIAIVGTTNSPGIYDMMLVLGKLEIIRRFTILER